MALRGEVIDFKSISEFFATNDDLPNRVFLNSRMFVLCELAGHCMAREPEPTAEYGACGERVVPTCGEMETRLRNIVGLIIDSKSNGGKKLKGRMKTTVMWIIFMISDEQACWNAECEGFDHG
ncbi:hypothetical protein L6452_43145 [Arctium lappa]|uniref:Uncharacterized protein n=1 Tax=Arctium lappa TaxID=4217 RepID=A0ACB8XM03_ARCLA|nr:hypothetical protein L6452_43145 [Arctium lappa]